MPRSLTTVIVLLGSAVFPALGQAQPPTRPAAIQENPCGPCHTCDNPKPEDPCLRHCLRTGVARINGKVSAELGPDVVILDELEDLYLPVPFDHRGHAEMAQMTMGCTVCHHYTPEGVAHPECKSCHEVATIREDMRRPGLKGAYHRQCMACHREWSHETACEVCHQAKAGRVGSGRATTRPTKDDIVGRMHPPIPEPDTKVYQTKHRQRAGTKVTFRHKEHIHLYDLKCAECHREASCSRCHEEGKSEAEKAKTLEEHHNPCVACHDMESPEGCDRCHWDVDQPEPRPFDHAKDADWSLGRYHEGKSCRVCHREVPFKKRDRACNNCHAAWSPVSFNHAVTGQVLDENHVEQDCEFCHVDRKFNVPPTCTECHDADEGIAFPKKRPGPVAPSPSPATD